jgi:chemotaxis protein CheD
MSEAAPAISDLTLHPGELYVARTPAILRTILGSCVGVTLWSPRLGAGALCHGVLPRAPARLLAALSDPEGPRFVDFSIRYLARQFDALGARRGELEVKVFGGADVLPLLSERADRPTVGALNREAAEAVLAEEGLIVTASDVGGKRGRKIHFDTATGEVLVYRLQAWDSARGKSGEAAK